MNKDIKFDTNGDILYEIAMIIYDRHNSNIATINDHLGEIYSYQDLQDAERCELEDEKHLLELAVKQLQEKNKQLKEKFVATNKGLRKVISKRRKWKNRYYNVKKQLKQRDEVIDEAIFYISNYSGLSKINISGLPKCNVFKGSIDELLEILQKYKGDNK